MQGLFSRLGDRFERIPDACHRRRWWVWLVFLGLIAASIPGVMRFEMDLSDEQFFHQSDDVRRAYDRFRAQFGSDDSVYLVYQARDGDVFSHASLTAVRDLQEAILNYRLKLKPGQRSPLDHIVDITSLINVAYLEPSERALIARPFIGRQIPTDPKELSRLRQTALAHPDYPLVYVSQDGSYGAMLIRTDFRISKPAGEGFDTSGSFDVTRTEVVQSDPDETSPMATPTFEEYTAFYHALEVYMQRPEIQAALAFYPVGGAPIHAYINDELLPQINTWLGVSLLLIVLINWLLFRSLSAMVWPIVVIAVSALWMVATLGYLQIRMNMMINVVVLLILAIGVADAIHILSGYVFFRQDGADHHQALRATYRKSGLAVTLTSLTTAAGMLALLFVPLIPIQLFGFASALGVLFAYLISVFVLPVMLGLWAPLKKTQTGRQQHFLQRLLRRVEHLSHCYPRRTIAVFGVLGLVLLAGAWQIRVDTNFMNIFVKGSPIRTAQEKVEEHMGGTMSLEIMISSAHEFAMLQPQMLNRVADMQHWLETELSDVVTKTRSLVDIVRDANRSLHAGQQAYYTIPQDPQVLRQTLFLFDNANPRDRALLVSDDYRQTHLSVVFRNQGSKAYVALLEKINAELKRRFADLQAADPSLQLTPTGNFTVQVRIIDYVSWSQIYGFGIALLSISIIMFLVFRSVRVGLIALLPNTLPLLTVFGIMGYAGINLDTDTLLVAPMLIGIVVDDTIHFLTHYRALMEEHDDFDIAIVKTFREVGQAITFTSIILIGAFVCFGFLEHNGLRHFGILASVAMLTALAGDLLLLPALLKLTRTRFNQPQRSAAMA